MFVRSHERVHTLELLRRNVDFEIRETFESALAFGAETLRAVGLAADDADVVVEEVRRRDAERLEAQFGGQIAAEAPAGALTPEPLVRPLRRGAPAQQETGPERDGAAADGAALGGGAGDG